MTIAEMGKYPLFKDNPFSLEQETVSTADFSESVEEQRSFNIRKVEFIS